MPAPAALARDGPSVDQRYFLLIVAGDNVASCQGSWGRLEIVNRRRAEWDNGRIMNKKDRFVIVGLVAGLAATAGAAPPPNQSDAGPQRAKHQVQATVEVGDDSGGFVAEYALRLYEILATKQKVKFVGRCDSACTLYLALPSEQTCITEGAYFRFHAPSGPSVATAAAVSAYLMRKYPTWVRAWIVAQGGLSDRLITMTYEYADKFIPICSRT